MTHETLQARLIQTEAALAHLERNFDDLNGVVISQGKMIARLQKRLDELGNTLQAQETDRGQPHNQKPPHYAP